MMMEDDIIIYKGKNVQLREMLWNEVRPAKANQPISDFTTQRVCKHACTGHNHICKSLSRHWNISFSLQASGCYPFTKKTNFG